MYPQWYGPNTEKLSNQVGHFLTAVDVTYNWWNIGLLIGHEKVADGSKEGDQYWVSQYNNISYAFVTTEEFNMFYGAVQYDEQGIYNKRDELLWAILNFDEDVNPVEVSSNRDGNSLQDFRLSLKGYRFAKWVRENKNTPPAFASSWLRLNLMPLSTIPQLPR